MGWRHRMRTSPGITVSRLRCLTRPSSMTGLVAICLPRCYSGLRHPKMAAEERLPRTARGSGVADCNRTEPQRLRQDVLDLPVHTVFLYVLPAEEPVAPVAQADM